MFKLNFKNAFFFLILLLSNVFSTQQIDELIIIYDDTLILHAHPLADFFPFYRSIPRKYMKYSGGSHCWRGYQGLWELKNDSLYLREIYSCNSIMYYSIIDSTVFDHFKEIGIPKGAIDALKKMKGIEFSEKTLKEITGKEVFRKYRKSLLEAFEWNDSGEKMAFNKEKIVKKKYINNNYFASEFSGTVKVPIGKLLFREGFTYLQDVYDKYLFLTFSKGKLIEKYRAETIIDSPNTNIKN